MAIKPITELHSRPIQIDLTGAQGNAFFLIGTARALAKKLEWTPEQITAVTDEMKSGDYENLLKVFEREFGDFVTMYR